MIMNNIFSSETVFSKFMNNLADVLWIGILWLITSIPIVTMGAASCAAYQTMMSTVRGKKIGVTSIFFEVFKDNFRITWPMKLIGVFFVSLLLFDCIYLFGYGTDFSMTLSFIIYIIMVIYIALISYLYPLTSRYDEKRFLLFKMSFYLTFRYILSSIMLVALFAICLYACYLMPWSIIIVPGIYWYIMSFPVNKALNALTTNTNEDIDDEEDEEEINDEQSGSPQELKTRTVVVKRRRLKKLWRRRDDSDVILDEDLDNEPDEETEELEDRIVKK